MKSSLHKLFALFLLIPFFSCTKDEPIPGPVDPLILDCVKPAYLKAGDKVALISPSYHTPMENVEKTADVLRGWGLEPVIGPNVGKVVDVVMGAPVTIDVRSTGSTISFGIEGQQKEYQVSPDLKSTKSSVEMRMMLAGKKSFGYEGD